MDKEKLISEIMRECEKDGEPITRKEAEEMAEMELKAKKEIKRYEKANTSRKKSTKVRKVDVTKQYLLDCIKNLLSEVHAEIKEVKTETEVTFIYEGNEYSVKLIKHRPPK